MSTIASVIKAARSGMAMSETRARNGTDGETAKRTIREIQHTINKGGVIDHHPLSPVSESRRKDKYTNANEKSKYKNGSRAIDEVRN